MRWIMAQTFPDDPIDGDHVPHPGTQRSSRTKTTRGGDLDTDDLDEDERIGRGGMGVIDTGGTSERPNVGTTGAPDDMSGTRGASGSSGDLGDTVPDGAGTPFTGGRGNR